MKYYYYTICSDTEQQSIKSCLLFYSIHTKVQNLLRVFFFLCTRAHERRSLDDLFFRCCAVMRVEPSTLNSTTFDAVRSSSSFRIRRWAAAIHMRASSSSSRRRDEVKGQDRAVVAQQPSSNTEREKRSSTLFRLEIITHILRQERLCWRRRRRESFLIIFSFFVW